MATLNPRGILRRLFPTARRLLVESDISRWCVDEFQCVLAIGAGHDPYRKNFTKAEFYVALDVIDFPGITNVVADAVALPFDDNAFDCVVAIEVMEHIEAPTKFIDEAYRALSPGGTLLLSVPFAFHQHGDPSDYWRPTRHALDKATSRFSSSVILPQGNRLHVISDLITTAFYPVTLFLPLRILNYVFVFPFAWLSSFGKGSTAPSGYFVVAKK